MQATVDTLRAYVYSRDVLAETGLRGHIDQIPEMAVEDCPSRAHVAIVATAEIDGQLADKIAQLDAVGCGRVLVVVTEIGIEALPAILEIRAAGVLRARDATPRRLADAARAAASGGGSLPPDLIGHLLRSVHHRAPLGSPCPSTSHRLNEREEAVIRLLAEGYDTQQIAAELHYSERTIKSVVHGIIRRLGLRNRPHAVAYALRHGLI